MSRSRSMFRTAGSLAAEFVSQMEAKKWLSSQAPVKD
jgi:hypothetical protein